MFIKPKHPGTITITDGRTQKDVDTLDASQLSDGMKYVHTQDGWEPVVRIVDNGRSWISYGTRGQFLQRGG